MQLLIDVLLLLLDIGRAIDRHGELERKSKDGSGWVRAASKRDVNKASWGIKKRRRINAEEMIDDDGRGRGRERERERGRGEDWRTKSE